MNPTASLPLRDIHLPDAVSWWPPAIGWWIVSVLLMVLAFGLYRLIRYLKTPLVNKGAKEEMGLIIKRYQQHQDGHQLVQECSVFFRRVGISYLPREQSAGVVGIDWYQQLNALVDKHPLSDELVDLLVNLPYQKTIDLNVADVKMVIDECQRWVDGLPRQVRGQAHV